MALSGNEILYVLPLQPNGQPAATTEQTTTGAIAQLGTEEGNLVETVISTAGNGTLTGAALAGGQIARSGPSANFTDTTDTAANILAALPSFISGATFIIRIKNATAYTQTLANGSGVTLPSTVLVPPFSFAWYFGTQGGTAAVPTYTFTHMLTAPIETNAGVTAPSTVTLATIGNGTILATAFALESLTRTGFQSGAFTDTTDTAANIIAAQPSLVNKIGSGAYFFYTNSTNDPVTLTGGMGVTVNGTNGLANPIIPPGYGAEFIVTYTAAATLVISMLGYFPLAQLPVTQFTSAALSASGPFLANQITGANYTILTNTTATPGTVTTRTAAQMFGDIPNAFAGLNYMLKVIQAGVGTLTIGAGSGVTITGLAAITTNTWREYQVLFPTISTATLQNVGSGPAG